MKYIYIPILLMLFSCQTPTKISEQEVRETFNEFFDIVDNNIENFGSIITDDFYIFENNISLNMALDLLFHTFSKRKKYPLFVID